MEIRYWQIPAHQIISESEQVYFKVMEANKLWQEI
jgi:hypothetical protein